MVRPVQLPFLMQSGGRWYFRRKGVLVRLPDPESEDFLAAYDAARRGKPAQPTRTTVNALIEAYQRTDAWTLRARRTQKDYAECIAYLAEKIGDRDVSIITTPIIVEMMQRNHERGRTIFANKLLAVVSKLCTQATLMGWMRHNPAIKVPKCIVPEERRAPHRPWPDGVVSLWRKNARPMAVLGMELGLGTVQRPGDVVNIRWRDYDGAAIALTQSKTSTKLVIPCSVRLKAVLDATPRRGFTILTNRSGMAFDYKRYAEMMQRERARLGTADYDLHGLRYRGVMELTWAGCSDDEIASFSGHLSKDMIKLYAGEARQIMRARQAAAKRDVRKDGA